MTVSMDLAVALEVASLRMRQARSAEELAGATSFNRQLWQTVRRLADSAADAEARRVMLHHAADADACAVGDRTAATRCNRTLAGLLVGRWSGSGALSDLLDAWNRDRRSGRSSCFEGWLLSRLDHHGAAVPLAA
jgi:hypothetical protein